MRQRKKKSPYAVEVQVSAWLWQTVSEHPTREDAEQRAYSLAYASGFRASDRAVYRVRDDEARQLKTITRASLRATS